MQETGKRPGQRREQAWRNGEEELDRQRQEWSPRVEDAEKQFKEAKGLRRQLAQIREKIYERYRNRRDRLNEKQKALRVAAKRLQDYKQQLDEEAVKAEAVRQELALGRAENESRAEQIQRERTALDEQHQVIVVAPAGIAGPVGRAGTGVRGARAQGGRGRRAALEQGQQQHQADLVRLDRIQAQHDQRQKQLEERALEVDKRYEQLQRDLRDLEEQAVQMDEWHNRLSGETEKLAQMKQEHETAAAQVEQRAAALEGQQAMLATLRTRMERMREELRAPGGSPQRPARHAGGVRNRPEGPAGRRPEAARGISTTTCSCTRRSVGASRRGGRCWTRPSPSCGRPRTRWRRQEKELNERQEQQDATAAEQAEQVGSAHGPRDPAGGVAQPAVGRPADAARPRDRAVQGRTDADLVAGAVAAAFRGVERASKGSNPSRKPACREEAARLEEQTKAAELETSSKAAELEAPAQGIGRPRRRAGRAGARPGPAIRKRSERRPST